jgi:hypothetical protein
MMDAVRLADGMCLGGLLSLLGVLRLFGSAAPQRRWGGWLLAQGVAVAMLTAGQVDGSRAGELGAVAVLVSLGTAFCVPRAASRRPADTASESDLP